MNKYLIYKEYLEKKYYELIMSMEKRIEKSRIPSIIINEEIRKHNEKTSHIWRNKELIDFDNIFNQYFIEDKYLTEEDAFNKTMGNISINSNFDPIKYAEFIIVRKYNYFLRNYFNAKNSNEIQNLENDDQTLIWNISEADFVRLVYSLNKSGYVKMTKDTQLKLVENFANKLEFPLSKNWVSNHSKVIKNTQSDKSLAVFEKLKSSYYQYIETVRNKEIHKNNK